MDIKNLELVSSFHIHQLNQVRKVLQNVNIPFETVEWWNGDKRAFNLFVAEEDFVVSRKLCDQIKSVTPENISYHLIVDGNFYLQVQELDEALAEFDRLVVDSKHDSVIIKRCKTIKETYFNHYCVVADGKLLMRDLNLELVERGFEKCVESGLYSMVHIKTFKGKILQEWSSRKK